MDSTFPIVRLELERMSHTLYATINAELLARDVDIRRAVEEACKPENVRRILRDAVNNTLNDAINHEVRAFFTYGKGQEGLKRAVADLLSKQRFD